MTSERRGGSAGQGRKVTPTVRYVSGTMDDEAFNTHEHVRQIMMAALKAFHIDPATATQYELRREGQVHALPPEQTLTEAMIGDGTVLLLTTRDQTDVDG